MNTFRSLSSTQWRTGGGTRQKTRSFGGRQHRIRWNIAVVVGILFAGAWHASGQAVPCVIGQPDGLTSNLCPNWPRYDQKLCLGP